jgi:hypothetical protein
MNMTYTENGSLTNASSGSALVDFFGLGGALRTRSEADIQNLFEKAYAEDKLLATKMAFYFRDVRGGQGERKTFRAISDWLAAYDANVLLNNLENIPFYGRWDDLIRLAASDDEMISAATVALIEKQLNEDLASDHPSLLAKWMPSENASSRATKKAATELAKKLGLSPRQYRKNLTALRNKISIVESYMCQKEWNGINFENVPSRAAMLYRKAFQKNAPTRYAEYLSAVEAGEKTIKASALYPYELVGKFMGYNTSDDRTLEAQWKALPDYLPEDDNGIAVCDVSGSMMGLPMQVSVSLGIYLAERSKGAFKDYFITFSARPKLQKLEGNTLKSKVQNLCNAQWDMNTNVNAVFDLILDRAKAHNVPQSDMPSVIYIISDMQFDSACSGRTNFEVIRDRYKASGYEMPTLVFWNVNARHNQSPVSVNDEGVVLVSGCSPSIFESVLSGKSVTPYDQMIATLSKPRYDNVKV